jgi:hypothetical protein
MLIVNHVITWCVGEPLPVVPDVTALWVDRDELDYLNKSLARGGVKPLGGPAYVAPNAGHAHFLYLELARAVIQGRKRAA